MYHEFRCQTRPRTFSDLADQPTRRPHKISYRHTVGTPCQMNHPSRLSGGMICVYAFCAISGPGSADLAWRYKRPEALSGYCNLMHVVLAQLSPCSPTVHMDTYR